MLRLLSRRSSLSQTSSIALLTKKFIRRLTHNQWIQKRSNEQIFVVQQKLNNRPRKTLNYLTPNEEFLRLTGQFPSDALRC